MVRSRWTRGVFFICLVLLSAGCATTSPRQSMPEPRYSTYEKDWGIHVEGVRLSAGGYMLDFRYRVLDPQKAAVLFNRNKKPYLIDQKSGAKVLVPNPPKVGPLRTTDPPKKDKIYFILFANPGQFIKKGNPVTIVIGDFKAKDLIIE